jgi:voltage-gated potassium channel
MDRADKREPDSAASMSRSERWIERRVERKGLRPRDAAYILGAFWAAAVVAFGVLERIVDPKTFHSVWLGMWWAVETVTTVGYGDVVPKQTVGKLIAGFLMLGGLSLIAVVTAAITSGFVSRAQAGTPPPRDDPVLTKLDELSKELRAVKAELERLRSGTGPDSSA